MQRSPAPSAKRRVGTPSTGGGGRTSFDTSMRSKSPMGGGMVSTQMAQRSSSVRSTMSTASTKTNFTLSKAMQETDRELQRHLQSLLHLKNRLRRSHDAIGKEYSTVTAAVKESITACEQLDTDLEDTRRTYQATQEADGSMERHALLVHGHLEVMKELGGEAQQVLSNLSLTNRELQHLMVLVDRATDIDMQCLDGRVPDAVITNGSPLFPHLTINDADKVMDNANGYAAQANRVAQALRRSVTTSRGEASHSAKQFEISLNTAARIHAEAAQGAVRHVEGLRYELGRLQKQKAGVLEELEGIEARVSQVSRTIALRETAKDAIFSKAGVDPVIAVLQRETNELGIRRSELHQRLATVNDSIDKAEREKQTRTDTAALATHKTESFCNAAASRAGSLFSKRAGSTVGAAAGSNGGVNSRSSSPNASVRRQIAARPASSRSGSPNPAASARGSNSMTTTVRSPAAMGWR